MPKTLILGVGNVLMGDEGVGVHAVRMLEHDGQGNLRFAERPFVIMVDQAFVDLGLVSGPLR